MEQTGNFGTVNGVTQVRNWTVNRSYANVAVANSNLKQGTTREKGPFDWTGSYSCYGTKPLVSHMPGNYVSLSLYKNPDSAGVVATGELLTGTALISSIVITWDWKTNTPANYVCNFGGHGDLTDATGAPYADTTVGKYFPPCDGYVQRVITPTPVRVSNVTQAVLTISREMKTAVNSGTTAGSGKCTTKRYPGGPVDWNLALTREEGNIDTAMMEGSIVELKIFVDATDFWHLQWGLVKDQSGINVNVETGEVISYTNNIEMKGMNIVTATPTLGKIRLPGAVTDWWPV